MLLGKERYYGALFIKAAFVSGRAGCLRACSSAPSAPHIILTIRGDVKKYFYSEALFFTVFLCPAAAKKQPRFLNGAVSAVCFLRPRELP